MKFMNWEQFEARHPDLADVIERNPTNQFCQDMRERIVAGKDISIKQRSALESFLGALAICRKNSEIDLVVDLTGSNEKGIKFRCPELRFGGRFTWDLYEETFPAVIRDLIKLGVRATARVQATVEWVSDDGGFVIANAIGAILVVREDAGDLIRELANALKEDRPAPTSTRPAPTPPATRSGTAVHVAGVYYYRDLEFKADGSDKFWRIAVEKIVPPGHDRHFRVFRHWGRNGSRGQTQGEVFDTYEEAIEHTKKLTTQKSQKGYSIKNRHGVSFNSEAAASETYLPGSWYDATTGELASSKVVGAVKPMPPWMETAETLPPEPEPPAEPVAPAEPVTRKQALLPAFSDWKNSFE